MDSFKHAIDSLLQLLIYIADIIIGAIVAIELWLRGQLTQLGVSHNIQTVILIAFAALLIIGSLRLFAGLIRVAVLLVLILIVIGIVMPLVR